MVRLGLDLPPELLALACASHSGEPFHVDGVRRILAAAGLDESALQTPPDYPLDDDAREAGDPRRRGQGAGPDELLGQARRDAGHLRRQRLGHRDATATPTIRCSRRSRTTFAELTGEPVDGGRGRRLRRAAAVHLAGRAGPRLPAARAGLDGADRPDPARRGSPTRSGRTRRTSPAPRATSATLLTADPRRDRQGGRRVLLRRRAARRPGVRAQDRRRRAAGAAGADGRGAAAQRSGRRGRASTPTRYVVPGTCRCSAAASRSGRSAPASERC